MSRALIRFESIWPRYEKSMLLRIRMTRIDLLEMRARCTLAMAEKPGDSAPYLRQAADDAARLEKEGHAWASAHALYIRSGIAACKEDPVRAVGYLMKSADCFDQVQMPLRAHICGIGWVRSIPAPTRAPSTTGPSNGSKARGSSRGPMGGHVRSGVCKDRCRFDRNDLLRLYRGLATERAPGGPSAAAGPSVRRERAELDALPDLWRPGTRGVVALVGLGGPARRRSRRGSSTSCAEEHLTPRPEGLFVWSFYQEPDAGYFLKERIATSARGSPRRRRRAPGCCTFCADALRSAARTCWCSTAWSASSAGRATARASSVRSRTRCSGPPDPDRRGDRADRRPGHEPVPAHRPEAALGRGYRHRDVEGLSRPRRWLLRHTASGATTPRSRSWWNRTGPMP